jgi:predicted RNA binding protein YcfA (HicA-like mRNA interferase family)
MSPKLPRVTSAELLRALHSDGWFTLRQSGSHVILRHPAKRGRIVVPRHAGVTLKPKVISDVLEQAGLTVDDLRRLL